GPLQYVLAAPDSVGGGSFGHGSQFVNSIRPVFAIRQTGQRTFANPVANGEVAPIPDNITGRRRKPHSRTVHTIGDETAGLAARRKTQIFEAVANGGGLSYMHSGLYGRGSVRQMRGTTPLRFPFTKI